MRRQLSVVLKMLIVIFVIIGTVIMFRGAADNTGLATSGFYNLKYYTVLSNLLCGIVTLVDMLFLVIKKRRISVLFRLIAVSAVGVTFAVVAFFLQPMYRDMNMYKGGNLWFHLIIPVTAMIEFIFVDEMNWKGKDSFPFKYTFFSAVTSVVYGFGYLINILVNGKGEWPHTNDWYGFLNWGYPVGTVIFVVVVVFNWAVASGIRALTKRVNKRR
ncbi:hypothetical protein SAMN04487934_106102 [Eubacterium ruminantium]|nr:hypothetical protein SAMN04487934_106102 [Eubacterium ruminantium]